MFNDNKVKDVAEFIKETVEFLKNKDCSCGHYEYGDVCIVVGWMPGYDEEKDDAIIQSENDPTWAINAGVRVHNSYMYTDMGCDFNYLYWPDSGDCRDYDISISPDEDYEKLARELLETAEDMNKYKFEEDGKILGTKAYCDLLEEIEDCCELDTCESLKEKITEVTLEDGENEELLNKLQEKFDEIKEELGPDYDRRAVEKEYNLEDGELDSYSIRDAEWYLNLEEGELGRFLKN